MQQWTLERSSESPESSGRPSLLQRDVKLFRSESRQGRYSSRSQQQPQQQQRARLSGSSFPADPFPTHHSRISEEAWEEEEGRSSGTQRLSRHIPQRTGIDMAVSAFNLIASPVGPSQSSAGSPRGAGGNVSAAYGRSGTSAAGGGGVAVAGVRTGTPGSTTASHVSAAPPVSATAAGAGSGGGGVVSNGAAAATTPAVSVTPASSALTSFTESMVSDDSSYMTSLYNDILASNLIGSRSTAPAGTAVGVAAGQTALSDAQGARRAGDTDSEERDGGRRSQRDGPATGAVSRRGLGGEVLRFAATSATDATPARQPVRVTTYTTKGTRTVAASSSSTALSGNLPRVRSRTFYTGNGSGSRGVGAAVRVFNTTPERVLDAPQFPADAAQLLDWGANNSIAIGMGHSLYSWNGDSGQAAKVVDLDSAARIKCVQWLHKCSCIALSVQDGTTAIYDCRSSDFLRTVRLPVGLEVTAVSVKGPVLAVASDSAHGTTCAYDLRAKDALIATYEGHCGGVASLHYCAAEPFYLATGGVDGSVRVWDARRAAAPRYAFDAVHQGRVNAIRWDPQKRSRLFTGGEDGVLCLMDTHAPKRTMEMDLNAEEEGGGSLGASPEHLAQYITRAVNTQFPISGLVSHATSGEVVTAHKLKGQLQLRKTSTFHLLSTFTALHCNAPLSCLTMAPDKESVCAAQGDDTLKFWRVFDQSAAAASTKAEWKASHHQELAEGFSEALR